MSSFTDPTNSQGGGTGSSSGNVGGFFQMGEVDGIGGGANPNGYDPGAVQGLIDELMATAGPHMSEFQVEYLMYLMQEYGNQNIGVDADNQTSMNQYFGDVQDLWGKLYSADTSAPPTGADTPTDDFMNTLNNMITSLDNNPFFKSTPQGQTMLGELTGALQSISALVEQTSAYGPGPESDKLWNMWFQYNGSCTINNSTITGAGSPDGMDSMMRELGQVNQDVTGVSQSIGTEFQSDTNNQQSESGALNNYLQMLYKMTQVLVQNMQSSSS